MLVTGGTGFIGRAVVERLVALGGSVTVITRSVPAAAPFVGSQVNVVTCDLAEPAGVERCAALVKEADGVAYLASCMPVQADAGDDSATASIELNLRAALGILRDVPPGLRVCYVSSVDVYGRPREVAVREDHPTDPATFYAAGKLAAEKFLGVVADRLGFTLSLARVGPVYGPGEPHGKAITCFVRAAISGSPPVIYGAGDEVRDYLFVTDAAEGIVRALDQGRGIYNIASGSGISIRDLAEKVVRTVGLTVQPEVVPAGRPPYSVTFDISRARRDLGFAPRVSLDEGLAATVQWYRTHRT